MRALLVPDSVKDGLAVFFKQKIAIKVEEWSGDAKVCSEHHP